MWINLGFRDTQVMCRNRLIRTSIPSLVEMFEQSVHKFADQPAFVNMGSVMTFRKLEERSRAFAAYLQNELKLKKGDSCRDHDA